VTLEKAWNDFWYNFQRGLNDGMNTCPVAPSDRPLAVAVFVMVTVTVILLAIALVMRRRFVR